MLEAALRNSLFWSRHARRRISATFTREDQGSPRAASVFYRLALIASTLTASGFFLSEAGVPI